MLVCHCYSVLQISTYASTNNCSAYSSSLWPWNIWGESGAGWRISKAGYCYNFFLNTVPFWETDHLRLSSSLKTFLRLQIPPCVDTAQQCPVPWALKTSGLAEQLEREEGLLVLVRIWEMKREEFCQSWCTDQYYFVLNFYNHQVLPPVESHKSLSLMQHSNPVTRNDCLLALTSEADTLCCAGPPEMLWEKQWC